MGLKQTHSVVFVGTWTLCSLDEISVQGSQRASGVGFRIMGARLVVGVCFGLIGSHVRYLDMDLGLFASIWDHGRCEMAPHVIGTASFGAHFLEEEPEMFEVLSRISLGWIRVV